MPRFYIYAATKGGPDALWWLPDSKGYTRNITDAGLYSADEARQIMQDTRDEHIAVPEDYNLPDEWVVDTARLAKQLREFPVDQP